MIEPDFIYNYERFDSGEEALEAFHNTPNIDYKNGIKFLDWLVWKITKPIESSPSWHKTIWERALLKFHALRKIENRDAFRWNSGKEVFDTWMKYEVMNPNTGNVVENKRWIVDWFFDPINADLHKVVS